MLGFLFGLLFLFILFELGAKITGAFLSAFIWLTIKVPVGIVVMCIGVALCATVLLLPIGMICVTNGFELLMPGI